MRRSGSGSAPVRRSIRPTAHSSSISSRSSHRRRYEPHRTSFRISVSVPPAPSRTTGPNTGSWRIPQMTSTPEAVASTSTPRAGVPVRLGAGHQPVERPPDRLGRRPRRRRRSRPRTCARRRARRPSSRRDSRVRRPPDGLPAVADHLAGHHRDPVGGEDACGSTPRTAPGRARRRWSTRPARASPRPEAASWRPTPPTTPPGAARPATAAVRA